MTLARCVIGPMNRPMIATSVGSTYVTDTVTEVPSDDARTSIGRSTARRAAAVAAPAMSVVTAAASSAFASGELDGDLVADRHGHLDDRQHRHDDDGQRHGELDGGLTVVAASTSGARHVPIQTRSIALSITLLNRRAMRSAPPPAVAHATTSSPTSAAASRTSAYSVVA